jgi:hypothetical protein
MSSTCFRERRTTVINFGDEAAYLNLTVEGKTFFDVFRICRYCLGRGEGVKSGDFF